MPFKSTAQQRFMYSQRPEIARRWSDEMRGGPKAPKYQREHPLKAAGLPRKVGKALEGVEDVWRASVGAAKLRQAHTAKLVARQADVSETRRAATVANNNLAFRATRKNRFASGTSVGRNVEKAFSRQSVAPVLARRNPTAVFARRLPAKPQTTPIGKAGLSELMHAGIRTARSAPHAARAGFRSGVTGAKPRMSLGHSVAAAKSPTLNRIGQASNFAARNRGAVGLSTGIVGGSVMGAGLARPDVEKAYGDPEDARYYRLGAGSAVIGAGGAAAAAEGGRRIVRDTKAERKRLSELPRIKEGPPPRFAPLGNQIDPHTGRIRKPSAQEHLGHSQAHDVETRQWLGRRKAGQAIEHARRGAAVRHGAVVRGKPAAMVGGGLAALGGADVLRRRAHERRYN